MSQSQIRTCFAKRMVFVGWSTTVVAILSSGCQSVQPATHTTAQATSVPPPNTVATTKANPSSSSFATDSSGVVTTAFSMMADAPNATPGQIFAVESPAEKLLRPEAATTPSRAPITTKANAIDLGTALRLAGVDNPTINLAQERVQEALAHELAAQALLLPSVNVGGNLRIHRGTLQGGTGRLRAVDSQSLYLGAGASAIGGGTVTVPGVRLFAHLGDAYYEPLVASQRVSANRSDAQAVQNTILRDVATAYLELVGADVRLDALRQSATDIAEIYRLATVNAEAGRGRSGDTKRASANESLLQADIRRAEEDVAVASARLCQLLNLEPSVRLQSLGGAVGPLRLVPEESDLETLTTSALRSRPEIFARSAAILEAQTRVRQEQVRPWVPILSVGYSSGAFGGGSNLASSNFAPLKGRSDFDVLAVWNIENLGFGNSARVRFTDAGLGQTVASLNLTINQIRREVSEAVAETAAASRQMQTTKAALAVAEEGLRLEMTRIKEGEGKPLEVLESYRQLFDSRQEVLRATVAFNIAQFRLLVAIGMSPTSAPTTPESAVAPSKQPPVPKP